MKKNLLIYLIIIICQGIFAEKGSTMDRESLANECISGVIRGKVSEGKVVSPRGLVKTCEFLANYWVKYGEAPPDSIVPTYSQVKVEQMRDNFYGEW
mgnify:CR=1 FL=1|tara:strand:- start:81 stop:371 length:291 start_codon:yes stop_codon:yes gene_type:complete